MVIHNRKYLKDTRRVLRNNTTSAEAILWKSLQKSQLMGRKFRRQHSIGSYVADFYCISERLVVELDGQPHFTSAGIERDLEREAYLNSLNIRVVRFENREVFSNLEGVLAKIASYFSNKEELQ
jgi:very-short-patch-repair endonuclease